MKSFYAIALVIVAVMVLLPTTWIGQLTKGDDEYLGKVVRYGAYGSAVRSIDSATCGDTTSSSIQGECYEGLYCYHYLKRPIEVIPQLAAAMPEISEDGLTYTIRLKEGVRYARNPCFGIDPDGRPGTRTVRAEDFVLAFKRVADFHIDRGLAWAFLSGRVVGLDDWQAKAKEYEAGDFSRFDLPVEGLEAVDELTLRIRLTERFPQFIYALAMHVYAPVPRERIAYWLETEDDGNGGRRPIPLGERMTEFKDAVQVVGTGPYLLSRWKRKSLIVLERNPEFREEFYPSEGAPGDRQAGLLDDAGKRLPLTDVLRLDFVPEDYSAWMRFLSKQSDTSGIPKETFEFVTTPDKELADNWAERGIILTKSASPVVYWIAFNMDDPVVGGSRALRQALCLAYDVENHIKVLHNGRGRRAVNVLPGSFKGHAEGGPGPYYRLDLEAARAKLEEAKKELAAEGMLENSRIPQLRLDIGSRGSAARRQGTFMKQQFKKIGVDLDVTLNDWPTLQQKVNNKQCQLYTMGWHADYPDAENFFQLYYSGNIDKGTNDTNYANPAFDALYEQIRPMEDSPERTEIYARMVRILNEDCPVLLLSEPLSFTLAYDWVHNSKRHPIGYGFGKYIRIDVERRRAMGGR